MEPVSQLRRLSLYFLTSKPGTLAFALQDEMYLVCVHTAAGLRAGQILVSAGILVWTLDPR